MEKISKSEQLSTRLTYALAILIGGVLASQSSASTVLIDQSNFVGNSITAGSLDPGQSLGQSFTPSLNGIDFFTIKGFSRGISTTRLNLFAGQTTFGVPIATTSNVLITNLASETIEYQFPSRVSLIPGNLYTARIDLISGNSYLLAFSNMNPYSGGLAFNELGSQSPNVDLVFSEGIFVPEPSLGLLAVEGLLLLLMKRGVRS